MLLTITTTMDQATDLGFLLHKHPDRVQRFEQSFGTAHVFYPDADERLCTAALLLDVDPVKLVRTRGRNTPDFSLGQYVNDRPYAASSLLASAMANVFRTAMRGRCDLRPELAETAIPLEVVLPALPCRGGPGQAERFFAPLGWDVSAVPVPLDPEFSEWGDSRYVTLTLSGTLRLADALNQLYVLLPVLDDSKHYWMAPDEVDKLIRAGEGWLATHPDRGAITRRYLANRRGLVRSALGRLADAEDAPDEALDPAEVEEEAPATEEDQERAPSEEKPVPLAEQRLESVVRALREEDARRVIDLGCGSGKLLARLAKDDFFSEVSGTDVSHRALSHAWRRLRWDQEPRRESGRVHDVFQGALTYADERFRGYEGAVLMEVVEHVDPPRLGAVERVVFGHAAPRVVVVTTPNAEHNVRYEGLAPGAMRHPDHRFEWTRAEFRAWADRVAADHGYRVRHVPVGAEDPEVGAPTQMGVFTR
ncbi:3' terminal RNA ribose 2'-O-methyltransferase Hen1 [Actinomadura madurae]|uniref:3' terminal RNA ribose 2'-O-methyltransferase Hen1 n=1 Tax=Actinomadura madurae TaxID=1993 RepID=UPI0020D23B1E|nr:3' terminal RNA ribose 2'-O-methyltransferase Hen1 [Actinomadura madurae]MCP9949217.1 3' terminal RNA ribose 2'-O-methyltransferase Hen1 [Actinomadura madurae]MCP9965980.1 3' terminal RNA ribose 2'-O-methyltransferase Hen1 [Actinomadura madurae]MCP9978461.1 3' terminal RNA ribose 2'-O-methyltransferase Hen1 [Actinomadura madurae]MCQ0010013.1 3' terminal RNA ribose 2'-O-methyltransferase Hen1 [Actinomadura madurae]MCQ0014663.1 3' terminal RNA ribose 2'-O-methyltransferase Hen1 [Actinomadura 